MRCVSNEPQELFEFAGLLELEGVPSKLELLLSMEKRLMAACEIAGQEIARRNLSLVRRLILTERIKEWVKYQQVKIVTGFCVVVEEAKGWIDGLVEEVKDFLYPGATLSPAVITRGAIRTRGTPRITPTTAILKVKEPPGLQVNISFEADRIEILLQSQKQVLRGVNIWIVSASGEVVDKSTTDSLGKACFIRLPKGTYVFLIEQPKVV